MFPKPILVPPPLLPRSKFFIKFLCNIKLRLSIFFTIDYYTTIIQAFIIYTKLRNYRNPLQNDKKKIDLELSWEIHIQFNNKMQLEVGLFGTPHTWRKKLRPKFQWRHDTLAGWKPTVAGHSSHNRSQPAEACYYWLQWLWPELPTSECHSKRGGGNGLTNQNPPVALPTPSHIPLT
jgi:hypothetical protein